MTQDQLKKAMNALLTKSKIEGTDNKKIIGEAVQLGMQYQEEKIKEGINIVFSELNKK